MKNDRLAVAATFSDDVSAHIALGMLRSHGIDCVLNNEIMSEVFALPSATFGEIRLLVRAADLPEALSLLAHPQAGDSEQ